MAQYWTIRPHGVKEGGLPLISCRIAELVDDDGTHYAWFGPTGTWRAVVTSSNLPAELPPFTARLNGRQPNNWWIKIKEIDPKTGEMKGTWGHGGYNDTDIPPPGDSDTWTAQASSGTGAGGDDEPVAASASASSKK